MVLSRGSKYHFKFISKLQIMQNPSKNIRIRLFQTSASNCVKRQRSTTCPASTASSASRKPLISWSEPSTHCFHRSWVSCHAVISCNVTVTVIKTCVQNMLSEWNSTNNAAPIVDQANSKTSKVHHNKQKLSGPLPDCCRSSGSRPRQHHCW